MSLQERAGDVWTEVRQQVATFERPRADVIARRSRRGRVATGLAAVVVLALAGVGLAVTLQDDPAPTRLQVTHEPTTGTNGWVALDRDGDIYVVRPGEDERRVEVARSDTTDEACPTWSPDGTRLSFGRVTVSYRSDHTVYYDDDVELVIVSVGPDGAIGTPNIIDLDGFGPLPGFDPHPCATWAPDSRWVAFVGNGDVWVADTDTGAIRRLPGLRPTDLEWRPGTDELAIAGDIGPDRGAETSSTPVTVYSASTGELRRLGSVRAALLTWSPDGSTLAYQGGENDTSALRLVDADGANDRLLTHTGDANHGVGPVWSPTGERIAYQRLLSGTGERHQVVLVEVADGNETVISPPETDGPNGQGRALWYPYSVTWSPDGTMLLYSAWSTSTGVLAVRADTPTDVTVLNEGSSLTGFVYDHPWVPVQMWGRQPA